MVTGQLPMFSLFTLKVEEDISAWKTFVQVDLLYAKNMGMRQRNLFLYPNTRFLLYLLGTLECDLQEQLLSISSQY